MRSECMKLVHVIHTILHTLSAACALVLSSYSLHRVHVLCEALASADCSYLFTKYWHHLSSKLADLISIMMMSQKCFLSYMHV